MAIATLSQFARLADKRLDKIVDNVLPGLADKIPVLFGQAPLDKTWYEMFGVNGIGDVPAFNGKLTYGTVTPGFYTRVEPKEYAYGLTVEKKLKDDIQYAVPALTQQQDALMVSYARTKEKHAAKAFAEGTSTSWEYMTNDEGVSWFSTVHTTKSGVSTASGFSNLITSAFSRSALAAAYVTFALFRDSIGELYEVDADTIICPVSLADTVYEVVRSIKDPDSLNRYNMQNDTRWNVIPWKRLDDYSTKSWGICNLAALKKSLMWIDRIRPETRTWDDNETFATNQSIYGRFGWGWADWRPILWSNVS